MPAPANAPGSPSHKHIKSCPECGRMIAQTARTCLHCGKRLLPTIDNIPVIDSRKQHTIRWIAIAIATLAACWIIVESLLDWTLEKG